MQLLDDIKFLNNTSIISRKNSSLFLSKKSKLKAFTLAEAILTMLILGILAATMVTTLKPAQYKNQAFNTIKKKVYMELDNAYGDMSFFFHDKRTRRYIYEAIYSKTLDIRNLIKEKSFHFRIYRKSVNGNKATMQKFIDEIDTAIMARSTHINRNEDGTEMSVVSCENKLVFDLCKEIGGKYYDLMYPFRKEASSHAD